MNVEQNAVEEIVAVEVVDTVEMVQDYIVDIELSVVLRGHKQIAQYIGIEDFNFGHDQFEGVHSVFIVFKDGTKIRKELFDAHIVSDGVNDAVLKGNFYIEFDENGTDVDGALNRVINKFTGVTVSPFELSTFDIPDDNEAEMDSDERIVKSITPADVKLKFTLEESYGDN